MKAARIVEAVVVGRQAWGSRQAAQGAAGQARSPGWIDLGLFSIFSKAPRTRTPRSTCSWPPAALHGPALGGRSASDAIMLGRPPVRCCPAALLLRPRGRTRLAAAAAVTGRASTVDGAEAPALRRRHLATGPPGPGQKSGWVEQGRSELRAIGAGFRLLGSNTVLSFRVLAASPKSPATSRDLYPGLLRELPSARKHLGQNVRDLAMIVPFVGLLCIPGTSIILPVVVAAFPGILPSTFPHGQRHRDADIAGVFRQLDKRATGRVDVNVCYQLIADLPPVDGAAAAGSKGTLSDADSGRLRYFPTIP